MSLLSLPVELVELILSFSTNATLVTLSRTSTYLNKIALQAFFRRSRYLEDIVNGWLHSWNTPRETLEAIRAALFLKELSSVNWKFNAGWECSICDLNDGGLCPLCQTSTGTNMGVLKQTFDEIASLRAILARLPAPSMVIFDFYKVETFNGVYAGLRRTRADRDLWRTAFTGLLNDVLEGGCQILEVRNCSLIEIWLTPEDSQCRSQVSMVPYTPSTWINFKLNTLKIHSDMLMLSPLIGWTSSLLTSSTCAATLTSLSIQAETITVPSPFLNSLNLSNLVEFEINAGSRPLYRHHKETGIARFTNVAAFLARHSRQLKKVFLYGVGLPGSDDEEEIPVFDSNRDILPHLEDFTAHPAIVVWLLDIAISRSPTSIWRRNTTLESLTFLGITSEEYNEWQLQFAYRLFDEALSAVVRFCRWRDGEGESMARNDQRTRKIKKKALERPLEVMLRFVSKPGVHDWFTSHLSSSQTSILTQLTHISTLTISTSYSVEFSNQTIDTLPDWLALISSSGAPSNSWRSRPHTGTTLQRVNFINHPWPLTEDFPVTEDLFVKRVAERCVELKWLQMNWNVDRVVDLDSVRAISSPVIPDEVEKLNRQEHRFWIRWRLLIRRLV